MATRDEIEEALGCGQCCDVVEGHLRFCEPDECGVAESYRRTRERVVAGECNDWLALGRAAMAAMMAAEPWMHEHHDHRVVHDEENSDGDETTRPEPPLGASEARRPEPSLTPARITGLARERLARHKEGLQAAGVSPATVLDQPEPPRWWEIDGPEGLVELHGVLTVREVLRRAEHLVSLGVDSEAPEWATQREHGIDEHLAARLLLWAASDWLEVDDVLDLVATAADRMEWSHLRARDLFSELLGGGGKPER